MKMHTATIVGRRKLAQGVFKYLLHCPELATMAIAGQFVQVTATGFFLRRPISICDINPKAGTLVLVLEVRGEGTAVLSKLGSEDTMDIIGPLGKGFSLPDTDLPVALVGGGIGLPPMCAIASHYGAKAAVFAGFRTATAAILREEIEGVGASYHLCTDDGTAGHHGLVTEQLDVWLDSNTPAMIYACGPRPMLKAVAQLAKMRGIPCEVSLEEHMACGFGACLGCACKTKGADGETHFGHVCKDGPVFSAEEVVW